MSSSVIGALRVNLGLDSAEFSRGVQRVKAPLTNMREQFLGVTAVVAAAGAALAGIGTAINVIRDFETSMSRLGAVSGATSGELQRMRDVARELGATTEFSATQAADGLNFLAMAGFNAEQAMAAIPAVLDLATASGMGLAQAADTASNIMSGFGIAAENAANVADVLAAASSRANTDVAQLGAAMSTVAPIAAALEIELADTAAAIGVLSDAGIQGERAGTALRGVLASLAGPTSQAVGVLKDLGLSIADVDPATNELSVVMQRLGDAGLSTAGAMTLFGREAASGALVLVDGAKRLGEFGDELTQVDGAASDMAATMRDNLGGDIDGLQSAISGLMISLGDAGLTAILRGMVQVLTVVTRAVSGLVDGVAWVEAKIHEATNSLFGFGNTAGQTSRAIDNIVLSMRDEVNALDVLMGQIPAGTTMSRDAARAKLDEAKAIYTKIEAGNEEARQIALQSEAYQSLAREVSFITQEMDRFKDNSLAGGEFAPLGSREGLEKNLSLLQRALQAQRELLEAAVPYSAEAEQARATIALVEQALSDATGQQVTFNAGTGEGIVLTERLANLAAGVNYTGAISDAQSLANWLNISLSAALALSSITPAMADEDAVMSGQVIPDAGMRDAQRQAIENFKSLTAAQQESASAGSASASSLQSQISALEDSADPLRVYTREMAKLDALKLAGLSDGAYALAVEELANQLRNAQGATNAFTETFQEGFERALDYTLDGFKNGFRGLLDIVKSTILQAIKFAIANPIKLALGIGGSAITGGAGGLSGGLLSGLMGSMGGTGGIMGALTGGSGLAAGFSGLAGGTGLLGGLGNTLAGTFGTGGGIGGLFSSIGGGAGIMSSIGAALPVIGIALAAVSFFKTKTKLLDSGIRATIDMENAMFESFQKIQKSKFWGLSKKTSYKYSALSDAESDPINDAVRSVQDGVIAATEALGISSDVFEGFTHRFRVSLKGLDDAAKEAAITDALEGLGNEMAAIVLGWNVQDEAEAVGEDFIDQFRGGIFAGSDVGKSFAEKFRDGLFAKGNFGETFGDRLKSGFLSRFKSGLDEVSYSVEGAYDELMRLSNSLVTVNDVFRDLGFNAYEVSIAGADAAAYFADLFGSLENFSTATAAYYDQFYSDEEKLANATARLTQALADLGVNFVPDTNAAFRDLVETAMLAGDSDLAAQLIQLAPVFDSVTDAANSLESAALAMRGAYQLDASGYATAFDAKIAYEAANQGKISQDLIAAQNVELRRQSELLEKMQRELVKQSNAATDSNFQSSLE